MFIEYDGDDNHETGRQQTKKSINCQVKTGGVWAEHMWTHFMTSVYLIKVIITME